MSGEGITDGINSSIGIVEKMISINFSKGKTKFCLSLHYSGAIVLCMLIFKAVNNFKAGIRFPTQFCQFCQWSISEFGQESLNGNVYDVFFRRLQYIWHAKYPQVFND